MAFDWKRFGASFLNGLTEGIERREEEAKAYKEQQEELARTNLPLIQKRRMRADQAVMLAQQAESLGATRQQVQTALNSGAAGIQEFYEKLRAAANQRGVSTLGPADIDAIIDMPAIPEVDMTYADMVGRLYGTQGEPTPVPAEDQRGIMAKLFGVGEREAVKQELARTPSYGGKPVTEINQLAAQADYQTLMPDAFVSYIDVPYMDAEKGLDFYEAVNKVAADVLNENKNPEYAKAVSMLKREELTREQFGEITKAMVAERLEPVTTAYVSTYKASFFENPTVQAALTPYYSKEELDDLASTFTIDVKHPDLMDEPEVEEPVVTEPTEAVEPEAQGPAEQLASGKQVQPKPELTDWERAIVESRLSSRGLMRDMEDRYVEEYTREEWKAMTYGERRAKGLPTSPLGGLNVYFRDDIEEWLASQRTSVNAVMNMDQERYKLSIRGKPGAKNITKAELEKFITEYPDYMKLLTGATPTITIEPYAEGEKKKRSNINANLIMNALR